MENLDGTVLKDSINGSKLKTYKERREETIEINMLDWAANGNDAVFKEKPIIQEPKGVAVLRVHPHLTNAFFSPPTKWIKLYEGGIYKHPIQEKEQGISITNWMEIRKTR